LGYEKKISRVITLDPGIVHDRYALVMCHWDRQLEKVFSLSKTLSYMRHDKLEDHQLSKS